MTLPAGSTTLSTLRHGWLSHPRLPLAPRAAAAGRRLAVTSRAQKEEQLALRVCTHKTCRRQGSQSIAQFARDLSLNELEVEECGCLGLCGSGPSVVLLPSGQKLAHVSTPARVAQVLAAFCDLNVDATLLKATELRLAGNVAARAGQLDKAMGLYTQALELQPPYGAHLLLANRSGARLAAGDAEGAVEDAMAALARGPPDFTTATVRQVEALLRLGRHTAAMQALLEAVDRWPQFAGAGEYHMLVAHIREAMEEASDTAQVPA